MYLKEQKVCLLPFHHTVVVLCILLYGPTTERKADVLGFSLTTYLLVAAIFSPALVSRDRESRPFF